MPHLSTILILFTVFSKVLGSLATIHEIED